jgi:hypothetical protein
MVEIAADRTKCGRVASRMAQEILIVYRLRRRRIYQNDLYHLCAWLSSQA